MAVFARILAGGAMSVARVHFGGDSADQHFQQALHMFDLLTGTKTFADQIVGCIPLYRGQVVDIPIRGGRRKQFFLTQYHPGSCGEYRSTAISLVGTEVNG